MSISEQENKLFSEWEKNRPGFVRDGVVCETAYMDSNPKIAIILKDPHGDNDGDIRNWLRNVTSRDRTWDTVTRWVRGVREQSSPLEWECFKGTPPELKTDVLRSICAMNLKKSAGGPAANWEELRKVAKQDTQYIRDQYAIYDPDITICGGSGDLFKEVMRHNGDWSETSRGERWYERAAKKFVFDFDHPARPINNTRKFYPLIDAVNEVMNK